MAATAKREPLASGRVSAGPMGPGRRLAGTPEEARLVPFRKGPAALLSAHVQVCTQDPVRGKGFLLNK